MRNSKSQIENQYFKADLFEDICKRLEQQGVNLNKVTRNNISRVDEFHVRGAEVSNELVQEIYLNDAKVLDVGCGLGGPSRMLADRFNCKVFVPVLHTIDALVTGEDVEEIAGS